MILSAYRLGAAAFVYLVAIATEQTAVTTQIGLVAVACVLQVVLGLWENRHVRA